MRSLIGQARNTFVVILILGVTSALVAGTSAAFNATVGKPGTFSATALAVPTPSAGFSFTVTASGNDFQLAWANYTPPVPVSPDPGVTGFAIFRAAAVGANCTTTPPAYGNVPIATLSAAATSYTDVGAITTFGAGTLVCYQLATSWTAPGQPSPIWYSGNSASQTNPTAGQTGGVFKAIAVDFGDNGVMNAACTGNNCSYEINDTIRITFNQVTNQPALTTANRGYVCEVGATNTLEIGSTWNGTNCGTSPKIGSLLGGTFTQLGGADDSAGAQTYTWNAPASTCAPAATAGTVLCIRLTANPQNNPNSITNTPADWKLTMASSALSGITSSTGTTLCITAACQPTVPVGHLP